MVQKLAVYLGLRTNCCGAKIETWHANKFYCADCHRSLDKPAPKQAAHVKTRSRRHAAPRTRAAV